MEIKQVYIVIPTFNRKQTLSRLLSQIDGLSVPEELEVKTIVVNDGSKDGTNEMLGELFPHVSVVLGTGNWWWTKCVNEGCKLSIEKGSDYILWLNDDSEVKPDFLSLLWKDYNELGKEAIIGCASISIEPEGLIDFAGSRQFHTWRMKSILYKKIFSEINESFVGVHPTWTLNGRGTFFPTSVLKRTALLDERFVQYSSDYDFALTAKENGVPVFISWNARVYNNLMMTSDGATFKNQTFSKFLGTFFNKYSVNYWGNHLLIYSKHAYRIFAPIFVIYVIIGTTKSFLFKYANFK